MTLGIRIAAGLLLVCISAAAVSAQHPKAPFLKSVQEAQELSVQSHRPIVLDFYADF